MDRGGGGGEIIPEGADPADASPYTTIGGLRAALPSMGISTGAGSFAAPVRTASGSERPSCLEIPLETPPELAVDSKVPADGDASSLAADGKEGGGGRAERHSAGLETMHKSSGPHMRSPRTAAGGCSTGGGGGWAGGAASCLGICFERWNRGSPSACPPRRREKSRAAALFPAPPPCRAPFRQAPALASAARPVLRSNRPRIGRRLCHFAGPVAAYAKNRPASWPNRRPGKAGLGPRPPPRTALNSAVSCLGALSIYDENRTLRILRHMGPVSIDRLDDRICLQKLAFLIQEMGGGGPFAYHWYIRGPHSPSLTDMLYSGDELGA